MALSARSRAALFEGLSPLTDPEAVEEMLAYFPARDGDEPVTREYLDARLADLRTDMHRLANRSLVAVVGTMLTGIGLVAALA